MVDRDSQSDPPQYRIPSPVPVPTEVLEARANRFVSLLVGDTVGRRRSRLSRVERRWLQAQLERLEASLEAGKPVQLP